MKVLIPIVIGLLVVGCGESRVEKVVKALEDAKAAEAETRDIIRPLSLQCNR